MQRTLAGILFLVAMGCSRGPDPSPAAGSAPEGSVTISGPFVHEHLALYLVEDPSAKSQGEFLTLAEGLASGQVKVAEKGAAQVNELMIENTSDQPCFIQAGDVVKGGQQDRTLSRDFVIPAKTAPMPISSFCVEHALWSGGVAFQVSTQNAYGRDLKCAIQGKSNQSEVWKEVAKSKESLAVVNRLEQPKTSSLNEELDNAQIQERLNSFRKALSTILGDRPHAVGMITAVNGRFSTADVYADPGLFRKLFPRLLESATLEALSLKADASPAPGSALAAAFLRDSEKGSTQNQKIREGLESTTTDNDKSVRFEYRWNENPLHHQTLSK